MNKTAIKNFAVWAREKLISDITYKASMLGITDSGIAEPLPISTNDLLFFDIGTKDYAEVSGNEIQQRKALVDAINAKEKGSKSYKEAKLALDVGKIFFSERSVIAYSALGIGRLIYQLPIPLCKMFIREIFEGKSPDDFDEETLITINKFFENNLNVSETSRQLYIHRNTLVYRLDKLQKSTGLDLRVFEDAITFKIALMVVKYMKYMESLEY